MASSNTVVVRVLGNTSSLSKSLKKAQADLGGLERINRNIGSGFRVAAIGAAVFGAAAVGAGAAGAAALAAMPLALAGLGIAFAAQNKQVQLGFLELADHVGRVGQRIAQPLVKPLVGASQAMIKAFDALVPSLSRIFAKTAPLINQFSKGLIPIAKQLGPVLERSFAAGVPVLQAFGAQVPKIIRGFNGLFKALGQGTPQFAGFVSALGTGLRKLLPAVGRLLTALAPIGTAILTTLIPALVTLLDWISAKVGPAFASLTGTIQNHPTLFRNIGIAVLVFVAAIKVATVGVAAYNAILGVAGVAVKAFGLVMTVVNAAMTAGSAAALGTRIGLAALAVQTVITSAAMKVAAAAQWLLNAAMTANPIGLVIVAIVALVAAFVIAYKKSETFRAIVQASWTAIKAATVAVFNFLKSFITGAFSAIKSVITSSVRVAANVMKAAWNAIKAATSAVWNGIKAVVSAVAKGISSVVRANVAVAKAVVSAAWNSIKSATTRTWNAIKTAVTSAVNGLMAVVNGIKGKVTGAFSGAAGWLLSAGRNIIQGLLGGIESMIGSVRSKLGALTNMIPDWKGPAKRDKNLLRNAGRLIMKGLIKGFDDGRDGIKKSLGGITDLIEKTMNKRFKKDKVAARHAKSAIKSLGNETKALMRNAKKREAVYKKLAKAQEALADVKKASKDYAASVASGVLSYTNITGLNTAFNSDAMVKQLQARLEKVRTFAALIKGLVKKGLNKTMIDQLVQAGVEGGLATATAIANGGPAAIKEFNGLQTEINAAAQGLGNTAAGSMYNAGIQAAAGLVKGLKANKRALERWAREMARDLVKAVKKALGIHSPSRVFKQIGQYTVKGLEIGLRDVSGVKAGMVNLADTMTNSFNRPTLQAAAVAGGGSSNTYNISITAPATVDKAAMGREIVGAIDAYERKGGRKRA